MFSVGGLVYKYVSQVKQFHQGDREQDPGQDIGHFEDIW